MKLRLWNGDFGVVRVAVPDQIRGSALALLGSGASS